MTSSGIKKLEELEKEILDQADIVNNLQRESIGNGYNTKGQDYEDKQHKAEKELNKMSQSYQKKINKASQILRNL